MSLFIDRDNLTYEQEFYYHGNEEHYSASPNYLLSSAGRFHEYEELPRNKHITDELMSNGSTAWLVHRYYTYSN